MKKQIILYTLMFVIFGVLSIFIYNNRESTKISYSFTLDVNPSIKVNVDSEDKVVNIKLLNQQAKDLFDEENLKGVDLDSSVEYIAKRFEEGKFIDEENLVVLFGITDSKKKELVNNLLVKYLSNKSKSLEIISPKITDIAKTKSIRYKITEAKAAYILKLQKDNNKLDLSDLVNKPVDELYNMLQTGMYCDSEYNLKGELCVKKIGEALSIEKKLCPEGYEEGEDACYRAESIIIDYSCEDGYTLNDNKCVKGEENVDATINRSCPEGFELYENLICFNYSDKAEYYYGKVCKDDNSELNGDVCYQYEVKDAYKKGE